MNIDTTGCDFIDFGYGKGGAYNLAVKKFRAKKGVSIDIRPESKVLADSLGHNCIVADVLDCAFPPRSVNFVTMVHFLEHLSSIKDVRKAVALGAKAAKSFIFFEGPAFEYSKRLRRYGLKFNWADWLGHPTHVTAKNLIDILRKNGFHSYMLFYLEKVKASSDVAIHPLQSPKNQRDYDRSQHPPKRLITFPEDIYKYFVIFGFIRPPSVELRQKLKTVRAKAILFEEKAL